MVIVDLDLYIILRGVFSSYLLLRLLQLHYMLHLSSINLEVFTESTTSTMTQLLC